MHQLKSSLPHILKMTIFKKINLFIKFSDFPLWTVRFYVASFQPCLLSQLIRYCSDSTRYGDFLDFRLLLTKLLNQGFQVVKLGQSFYRVGRLFLELQMTAEMSHLLIPPLLAGDHTDVVLNMSNTKGATSEAHDISLNFCKGLGNSVYDLLSFDISSTCLRNDILFFQFI